MTEDRLKVSIVVFGALLGFAWSSLNGSMADEGLWWVNYGAWVIYGAVAGGIVAWFLPAKSTKRLIDDNKDIIAAHVSKVRAGSKVRDLTRDCIGAIAEKEGKPRLAPGYSRLRQWEQRPDIPQEWRTLKDAIHKAISEKKTASEEMQRLREEEENARLCSELTKSNWDLVQKFFEIAERKVAVIDEYGEENWDALPPEIATVLIKIAKRNRLKPNEKEVRKWTADITDTTEKGESDKFTWSWDFDETCLPEHYRELSHRLENGYRQYHEKVKARSTNTDDIDGLSGIDFEMWLAKFLKEKGYEVHGTPTIGDQGADLIATKDGKKIIIQAKRYQGTVGNKAVQEVISALAYFGGDEGWVVTNSSFTPSAKALAQKASIRLVDGHMLRSGAIVNKTI